MLVQNRKRWIKKITITVNIFIQNYFFFHQLENKITLTATLIFFSWNSTG